MKNVFSKDKVIKYIDLYWFPVMIFITFAISTIVQCGMTESSGADTRCDFSDIIEHISGYSFGRLTDKNYPPLAVLFYRMLNLLWGNKIGEYQTYIGNYILLMILVTTSIIFYSLFKRFLTNLGNAKSYWAFAMFFTLPILWAYQWLNTVIFAFMATLIFLLLYKSENKYIRFLAYVFLAIAANFKYYPGIFILLLFKKGKIKEFIIAACLMAGLFFGPIFVESAVWEIQQHTVNTVLVEETNNLDSNGDIEYTESTVIDENGDTNNDTIESIAEEEIPDYDIEARLEVKQSFLEKMQDIVNAFLAMPAYANEQGWKTMAFMDVMDKILIHTHFICEADYPVVKVVLFVIYIIASLILFFITKREDHKWFLLSLMCVFVPTWSPYYSMVFMLIPFFNIANIENKTWLMRVECLAYFSMILPLYNWGPNWLMSYNYWHIILLYLIVLFDCVMQIINNVKEKKSPANIVAG